jgi:outer membrane protein TolC
MSTTRWLFAVVLLSALTGSAQVRAEQGEVEVSLEQAIQIATNSKQSTAVQRGEQIIGYARAGYTQARSSLLPDLDGGVSEQNQTVNIRALGLRFSPNPTFTFPQSVGPFYTFDARIRLVQNIFNLSNIRNLQAARAEVHFAEAEDRSLREQEATHVARLYAAGLRAEAELEAAHANVDMSEALRDLASHKKTQGESTEIDVARTSLAVARRQQQLISAQTERRRIDLDLINALNLGWNTTLKLTGSLVAASSGETPTVEDALNTAFNSRADLKEQGQRRVSARLKNDAAKLEHLPSLVGYGDYGVLSGVQTHTLGATLKIPLFDGGRMESDRAAASSLMRQEEIRESELRKRVQLEIRKDLATLASARQRLEVAQQSVSFADNVLAHANRLYKAGLTNSTEVIDAQTQLEIARSERVDALFDCANARIDLAEAMGTATSLNF